jgi:hypothetical protein
MVLSLNVMALPENKKPNRIDFMKTSVKGTIGATLASVGFPNYSACCCFWTKCAKQ